MSSPPDGIGLPAKEPSPPMSRAEECSVSELSQTDMDRLLEFLDDLVGNPENRSQIIKKVLVRLPIFLFCFPSILCLLPIILVTIQESNNHNHQSPEADQEAREADKMGRRNLQAALDRPGRDLSQVVRTAEMIKAMQQRFEEREAVRQSHEAGSSEQQEDDAREKVKKIIEERRVAAQQATNKQITESSDPSKDGEQPSGEDGQEKEVDKQETAVPQIEIQDETDDEVDDGKVSMQEKLDKYESMLKAALEHCRDLRTKDAKDVDSSHLEKLATKKEWEEFHRMLSKPTYRVLNTKGWLIPLGK